MKPLMMYGTDYAGQDVAGWVVTEKFDGFFARWDGSNLITRDGIDYNAPEWFTAGLPNFAIDCELFAGYGQRETLNSIHKAKDEARWKAVQLVMFDAPNVLGGYAIRHAGLDSISSFHFFRLCDYWICESKGQLSSDLKEVINAGGEGLVVRHPDSAYAIGRTETMLKVKPEFISAPFSQVAMLSA